MREYVLCCLKLVPLRSKNVFEPHLSNEILVPFRLIFENFRRVPASFLCESPASPGGQYIS